MVDVPCRHQASMFCHVVQAEHREQIAFGRMRRTPAGRVIGVMTPLYFLIFALQVEEAFRGRGIGRELMTRVEGIGRMLVPQKVCFFTSSPAQAGFARHRGYRLPEGSGAGDPQRYEKRFTGALEDWWTGAVPDVVFSWKKVLTEGLELIP